MIDQAVVLGGTGGLGKAVVDELISRNIPTKVLVRSLEKFKSLYPDQKYPGRVSVLEGELDSNQALAIACEHVDTIFVCFNTELDKWSERMPRWISRISDIAAALGARIVYPGNISNFGYSEAQRITEEHPQNAHTSIGQLSIALEQRMARAIGEGASLTILRFPHLFGPAMVSNIMGRNFDNLMNGKSAIWYGDTSIEMEFLYTKDAAMAMVEAALNPQAADTILHYPGIAISPISFIQKFCDFCSCGENSIERISSLKSGWKSFVSREFPLEKELFYLYTKPQILDGTKFEKIVGDLARTSLETALSSTYEWFLYWINL